MVFWLVWVSFISSLKCLPDRNSRKVHKWCPLSK
jgi:hypothetical protein